MFGSIGSVVVTIWKTLLFWEYQKALFQQVSFQPAPEVWPVCEDCVPRELIIAPAVGVDLTLTYMTAAIRYHNKTIVDVGRIDGGEEYKEVMAKYSEPRSFKSPPFDNIRDRLEWQYDRTQRWFRQARGLPSTPEIEILSKMLRRLDPLIYEGTRESIPRTIFPSLPELPNLPYGDFDEVVYLANLTRLRSYKAPGVVNQVNTAFAGMDYGLCKHWADMKQCNSEEEAVQMRQTLTISYTANDLVTERSAAFTPYRIYRVAYRRSLDLGSSHRDSVEKYWELIGQQIKLIATTGGDLGRLDTLVLIGESVEDKQFLNTVWKALSELGRTDIYSTVQISGFNAEFMAARGAAEMGKHAQSGPPGCVEQDWCNEREPGDDE